MFHKSLTQLYAYLVCVGCMIAMLITFNVFASDLIDVMLAKEGQNYDYKIKGLYKTPLAFLSFLVVFIFHWKMAKKDKARLEELEVKQNKKK